MLSTEVALTHNATRTTNDALTLSRDLILLPGLLCDDELWRDQLTALQSVVRCKVADLTRQSTISALAAEMLAEAPETFALAGFSFGGYVAQEIAKQAPNRIERLALLDTSIRFVYGRTKGVAESAFASGNNARRLQRHR